MAEIIRMPRLSDTMEEGNIVSWLKKVGDSISPGDILAEVETDKATMDLESFHEGTLLYIGVQEGSVPVDGIIAVIGKKGEDINTLLKEASLGEQNESAKKVTEKEGVHEGNPNNEDTSAIQAHEESSKIKASPLAKKIAKEKNIDLSAINGTGEGGRIVKRDVENLVIQTDIVSNVEISVSSPAVKREDQEITLSQMRKTIAKRLSQSKYGSPHFYLTIEVNMNRAVKARKSINAAGEYKISFNDIIVKAVALALRKHPMVNGSWVNDKIVLHGDINVGVAVAVEEGLVVPVIKHADFKSLSEINAEVKVLAIKAREKKIKLEEMQGNTFTISNLGMYGIEEFTAIINPPDACILAVGAIIQKPVVIDSQIVIGNQLRLTLSCDHRIVDGAKGSEFLKTLKLYLENPLNMLV